MGRSHNDEYGYKRGLGAYSDCNPGLTRKPDDGNKAAEDCGYEYSEAGIGELASYRSQYWKLGPLDHKGNSAPRYAPKGNAGTKSPAAASPSGRYAKSGGRGKGFGS